MKINSLAKLINTFYSYKELQVKHYIKVTIKTLNSRIKIITLFKGYYFLILDLYSIRIE